MGATAIDKSKMSERGRKSQYNPDVHLKLIRFLCRAGATDEIVAENLGISVRQLYRWYREHPELCQAKTEGKLLPDIDVEDSLLRRAKGYDVEETEVVASKDGRPVRVKKVKKHIPPDVKACRIWLSNRQPDRWGNRKEHSHQVEVNQTTKVTQTNSNVVVYLPDNGRG